MGGAYRWAGSMPGMLLKCLGAMLARWNHEPGAVVGGRAAGSVRVPAGGGTWMAARGPGDHDWFVRSSEGSWVRMGDAAFRNLQGRVADAGGVMVTREVVIEGGERVETVCRTLGHRLDGETRDTPGL